MEKMTPDERVAYAHGRINRALFEFEDYIAQMRRMLKQEMQVFNISLIISLLGLVTTAALAGLRDVRDFVVFAFIAVLFVVMRTLAYNTLSKTIKVADGLVVLFSNLADDTTLKFGFEAMRLEQLDVKTQPISPPPVSTPGEGGKRTE